MRTLSITILTFAILISPGRSAQGAGHGEITVIPMGQLEVDVGTKVEVLSLPRNPTGMPHQPIVLVAAQPVIVEPKDDVATISNLQTKDRRVPGTIRISVGKERLPDWVLQPYDTAFVLNLSTIRQNELFAAGRLALKIELASAGGATNVSVMSMPDLLLLKDGRETTLNGPLAFFEKEAADPEVKAYFTALRQEIAGEWEQAKAGYTALKAAKNRRIARFARRGLRTLSYQLRKRKLSGNLMEHYRWGLYLQFCGMFALAYDEFEECRIIDPTHGESQYRAGECLDRIGGGLFKLLPYMERAGEAPTGLSPAYWHTLVVIQKTRDNKTLTTEQIRQIKDNCLFAEKMILGATGGIVQTITSFYEVDTPEQQDYSEYPGGITAPSDDIIEKRGWFDSVFSIRPRLGSEARTQVKIAGGDTGLNGAAIASLGHDAGWPQYLKAFYGHMRWAAEQSEVEVGLPDDEDAVSCGFQPTPHTGHAIRAALHYYFPRAALDAINIAETPNASGFVSLWKIEGPFKVNDQLPPNGLPGSHVMDPIPSGTPEKTLHIASDQGFIDLAKLIPNAGWARARATSWVFSPNEQIVRLNLGRNDGIAVWLNSRCILQGRRYATGPFEDRNLVNTISTAVNLKKGWNELQCIVESWPGKWSRGWGFSANIVSKQGKPVTGLAFTFNRPQKDLVSPWQAPTAGRHYSWSKVKHDHRRLLPRLSDVDLRTITGVNDLTVVNHVKRWEGFVAVTAPGQAPTSTYRKPPDAWKADQDRDIVLNNLMDWARESCAAFRYSKGGSHRNLLFLKPEAVETFLTLLNEPDSAKKVFDGRKPSERVLGYIVVTVGKSTWTLLVVDAWLGDEQDWPIDEEDLLTPIGEYVPNPRIALPESQTASTQ